MSFVGFVDNPFSTTNVTNNTNASAPPPERSQDARRPDGRQIWFFAGVANSVLFRAVRGPKNPAQPLS